MTKNIIVTFRVSYHKLKMRRGLSRFRAHTKTTYPRHLHHYSGEEAEMERGKQKHASSIAIISLSHPHDVHSPKCATPMVTHDCFVEDCPCQHLILNNYRLCELYDHYACMKRIGDEWFFFAVNYPVFVINWGDAKWYDTREEALASIYLYLASKKLDRDE